LNFYLFSAYAVFWLLVFGYLVFLHKRQKRLSKELEELTSLLEEESVSRPDSGSPSNH
jgi:CcmD family protein